MDRLTPDGEVVVVGGSDAGVALRAGIEDIAHAVRSQAGPAAEIDAVVGEDVVAATTGQPVLAQTSDQDVGLQPTDQPVVRRVAEQDVRHVQAAVDLLDVGADVVPAIWHQVDVRTPVRELAAAWPAERLTLDLAQRSAPVISTHPLLKVQRNLLARRTPPPRVGRLSSVVSRRQWRSTPLYCEALQDVDDQLLLITGGRGPVIEFRSVERSGRLFRSRDEDAVLAVDRHLRAALSRTRIGALVVTQTAPTPLRTRLLPRPSPGRAAASEDTLTPRQREVLALVAQGLTDAQIGRRLGVTDRAVSKQPHGFSSTVASRQSGSDNRARRTGSC